ncbi:MAG TPA: hypothetical protein VKE74_30330 [Gemmataceae bacterium]|nr:hypothetical protein [Gemmataceae bacterium]
MKRFFGLVLAIIGGVATLWGGYCVLTGASEAKFNPLPVKALYGGLAGLACLTIGLVWTRD